MIDISWLYFVTAAIPVVAIIAAIVIVAVEQRRRKTWR